MMNDKSSVSGAVLSISVRTLINILIVLLLVEGFVMSYHFSYQLFSDYPYIAASSDKFNVTIEEGMDVVEVATIMENLGIVENKYMFIARAYIGNYKNKIQSGTYSLGPGMSPDEICRNICGIQSEEST